MHFVVYGYIGIVPYAMVKDCIEESEINGDSIGKNDAECVVLNENGQVPGRQMVAHLSK